MICGGTVTLNVSDIGRSVRFYVETLGMKLVEESGVESAVIDAGEGFRIRVRGAATPQSAAITLDTKVPIDEAIAIYENRGVTFTVERGPGVTIARFADPDGNQLALHQHAK